MKASENDLIRLLEDVEDDFSDDVIVAGTEGTVMECYTEPTEGYAVDLAIPDETLVGGYRYTNVILYPGQFEVIRPHS